MKMIIVILTSLCLSACSLTSSLPVTPTPNHSVPEKTPTPHPLSIQALRNREFEPSEIVIHQSLNAGSNYQRFIASHQSDDLTIYGLLTLPNNDPPTNGFPVIIFNHGYIDPAIYRTNERYVAYQDAFAREGYITFKSDYRGHDQSEGSPVSSQADNAYTIDVLNAVASFKAYESANPNAIGMWGHSMGGHITLEAMVVDPHIKAGVIWAGVVASHEDLFNWFVRDQINRENPFPTIESRYSWGVDLYREHGLPEDNPEFWQSIAATSFLADISGPIQLHHGTNDDSVRLEESTLLETRLQEVSKPIELYVYQADDHNLSQNLSRALSRSVRFFDQYLK